MAGQPKWSITKSTDEATYILKMGLAGEYQIVKYRLSTGSWTYDTHWYSDSGMSEYLGQSYALSKAKSRVAKHRKAKAKAFLKGLLLR